MAAAVRPILDRSQVADRRHRQRAVDRVRLRRGLPRRPAPTSPSPGSTTRRGPTSSRSARSSAPRSWPRSTSRRRASWRRCSRRFAPRWGRLDSLVHSIAFAPKEDLQGGLLDCSAAGFARAMDVSCHSFVRMAKLAAPLMTDGGTMFAMSYLGAQRGWSPTTM